MSEHRSCPRYTDALPLPPARLRAHLLVKLMARLHIAAPRPIGDDPPIHFSHREGEPPDISPPANGHTYILGVSEIGFGFFLRLMPGLGLRGAGAGATPDADMLDGLKIFDREAPVWQGFLFPQLAWYKYTFTYRSLLCS